MRYSDFPILSNEEYAHINEQFSRFATFGRYEALEVLCSKIQHTINYNIDVLSNFNKKTTQEIKSASSILSKILNSLTCQFNIHLKQEPNITKFNLFSFSKNINSILTLLVKWLENEEKEYYKTICKNCIYEILNAQKNIFSVLENSSVNFHKYM